MDPEQEKIRRYCQKMGIERLVHFTRMENLASIQAYGLLGRNSLAARGIEAAHNDTKRLDGFGDGVCLTIGVPNHKVFFRFRCDYGGDWVVITLEPRVLWERSCLFCWTNAANGMVASTPERTLQGVDALGKMFENDRLRWRRKIQRGWTTDPQAEVVVLNGVGIEYVENVFVQKTMKLEVRDRAISLFGRDIVRYGDAYFKARKEDYDNPQR